MQQPSVGRKVWYWAPGEEAEQADCLLDVSQPFDATVLYVAPNGRVNLKVIDHGGEETDYTNVELRDPDSSDQHCHAEDRGYATWMPYQKAQHDASKDKASQV